MARPKKSARSAPRYWRPLQRAAYAIRPPEVVEATMAHYGISEAEAIERLDRSDAGTEVWLNDLYQVEVHRYPGEAEAPGIVHLNIRRRDGAADLRDWRHFQAIKNQLVGEECEGIELYPAESRKVDTSNKWHIYVVDDPKFRWPVGWRERDVAYEGGKASGLRQRPL